MRIRFAAVLAWGLCGMHPGLHESAKFSDASQWTIQTHPLRFDGLINLLESFARDKFCPHFFSVAEFVY